MGFMNKSVNVGKRDIHNVLYMYTYVGWPGKLVHTVRTVHPLPSPPDTLAASSITPFRKLIDFLREEVAGCKAGGVLAPHNVIFFLSKILGKISIG